MRRILKRGLPVLLLVAVAAASFAPVAEAGRRRGHVRYRDVAPAYRGRHVVRVIDRRPVMVVRRHRRPGAFAGFLGGLVLGTVLSHARPACPRPSVVYEYYDPYCHRTFASLDAYHAHLRYHHHPRLVDVIDVRTGRCVDTYHWRDGGWCSRHDRDWEYEHWDD